MSEKKQMKYWEQNLATYMYNYCNIPIYLKHMHENNCNISLKHLKQLKHMLKTRVFTLLPYDTAHSEGWAGRGQRRRGPFRR